MDVLTFLVYGLAVYIIYTTLRWLVGKIKIRNIKDKSILITGCDTGFGHDAAIRFSQMGFQVFAGCYVKETLAYFDSYSPKGGNIIPFQLDVTDEQSITDAGKFVRSKLPKGKGIWAIINNAGIRTDPGPIQMLNRKHYKDSIAVNLYGVIDITREFLTLVQMERGRVVNTASMAGQVAAPGVCAYAVAKYGVEAFSDCLRIFKKTITMDVLTFLVYGLAVYIIYTTLRWLVGKIKIINIKDKSILITGCDTGFGHDAAIRFSQMGFQVFAGCYVKETLAYFDSYSPKDGNIIPLQLDVTDEQSITDAGKFVRSKLPKGKGIWAIINNAGIRTDPGPIQMLNRKHYKDSIDVNLYGVIDITREFLPLVQMERGRVVNTASMAGQVAAPGVCAYAVAKYGVEAFSDCLRREMHHFGVSVHIIEPGYFKSRMCNTDFFKIGMKRVYDQAPPEIKKLYGEDYLEEGLRQIQRSLDLSCSSNTDLVVDAYVHAATSATPHLRYHVGWLAVVSLKMALLPARVMDFFLHDIMY